MRNFKIGDRIKCIESYVEFKEGDVYTLGERMYDDGFDCENETFYIRDDQLFYWSLVSPQLTPKFNIGDKVNTSISVNRTVSSLEIVYTLDDKIGGYSEKDLCFAPKTYELALIDLTYEQYEEIRNYLHK